MKLYIKNMVCDRCKMVVKNELEKLGYTTLLVGLGDVELDIKTVSKIRLDEIDNNLRTLGFELIDDKRSQLIEKLKNVVVELVHYRKENLKLKHSEYISQHLHHDYTFLSKLFSEVEGITIEHYIIRQKIERVKELLMYDELSLSEIADKLDYSSVAHLSAQFKKITGLTPSFYKNKTHHIRTPLDKVK